MADVIFPKFYGCYNCRKRVALHDDIISKNYVGRHGFTPKRIAGHRRRAFLFSHVTNVVLGPEKDRRLITGLYTLRDVHCSDCGEVLGWRYEKAYEEAQKFKESKTVLEKFKIVKNDW